MICDLVQPADWSTSKLSQCHASSFGLEKFVESSQYPSHPSVEAAVAHPWLPAFCHGPSRSAASPVTASNRVLSPVFLLSAPFFLLSSHSSFSFRFSSCLSCFSLCLTSSCFSSLSLSLRLSSSLSICLSSSCFSSLSLSLYVSPPVFALLFHPLSSDVLPPNPW